MPSELRANKLAALVEAGDGSSRIQRLILALAIRGRLTAQDPADEDVRLLLKRIDSEREELVSAGQRRKPKAFPSPAELNPRFAVPASWTWLPLGRLVHIEMGQSPPSSSYNAEGIGLPFFQGKADFGTRHPIARSWCTEPKKLAAPSDVLLSVRAPVGPTNVADSECCIGRGLAALRPLGGVPADFILVVMQALESDLVDRATGTTFPAVSGSELASFAVPVPPLEEQRRIVARIQELVDHCVDVDRKLETRGIAQNAFRASALDALTNTASRDQASAWKRVSENWEVVTSGRGAVRELRTTIMRLAIGGRLVAQDARDRPATALLDQLSEVRGSRGSSLTDQLLPPLPRGWCWASFGAASLNRDAERVPVKKADRALRKGPYDYYGASGVIDRIDDFLFDGELLLIGEDGANLVLRSTPIAFMAMGRFWVNNHAHVIDSVDPAALRYLALVLNSMDLRPHLTGIAQPKLNQARLNAIPVPLPPLAEQHRIVDAVEELMDACDVLEQSLTNESTLGVALAESVARSLVAEPSTR